jgi:penicillin-binding protein 1A
VDIIKQSIASVLGLVRVAILAFATTYSYLVLQLPSVDALKDVQLRQPLRIYASGGELIAEFGEERRIPVKLDQIPDLMRKATLAAEDNRFYQHPGIDYAGLVRATLHLIRVGDNTQGSSTVPCS